MKTAFFTRNFLHNSFFISVIINLMNNYDDIATSFVYDTVISNLVIKKKLYWLIINTTVKNWKQMSSVNVLQQLELSVL